MKARYLCWSALLMTAAWLVLAQSTGADPAFEVASVKPGDPSFNGSRTSSRPGSVILENVTLRACIMGAYNVRDYQISSGPDWINSERYTINAKTDEETAKLEGGPRLQRVQGMLRTLLAERFQLVIHRETKTEPGYALVLAKTGLKMKEMENQGGTSSSMGPGKWTASRIAMEMVAVQLSSIIGRPVIDHTGVKGVFELKLQWIPDDNPKPGDDPQSLDKPAGPSLFTALQEQLGLKLEGDKVPVEHIIIDHAERPTEN